MLIVGGGFSGIGMAIRLRQRASTTSWSSSGPAASAAPGATTAIPAAPATCRPTSTRSRSRPTPTGRAPSRRSPRSAPTWSAVWPTFGMRRHFRFGPRALESAALGRRRCTLGDRDQRWQLHRRCARLGDRAALRPEAASRAAARRLPRQGLPLRALGPRLRPARQARRRDRHRRVRDPVRAARSSPRWRSSRSSSARAPWVMPRRDRADHRVASSRSTAAVPAAQRAARAALCAHPGVLLSAPSPSRRSVARWSGCARRHMESQITDPALRAKLTPDYRIGCKRILLSDDYYPALAQPNVDVVTYRIDEITAARRCRRRRHRDTGRRDHLRHRLPRHRSRPCTAYLRAGRRVAGVEHGMAARART